MFVQLITVLASFVQSDFHVIEGADADQSCTFMSSTSFMNLIFISTLLPSVRHLAFACC